jgi:hypothetical protein
MSDEQTNFKVTDRRLFNTDGTPRDIPPEEKPEPKSISATEETSTAAAAAARVESESRPASARNTEASDRIAAATEADEDAEFADAQDPASFINFLMSIASNAASALGMIEHPVTNQREVDLELGKHWIEVIGMLEKKTHGNLTAQEEKILEGLLADLRMQYVSLANTPSNKASRAYTGRDITGGK